MDTRSKALFLIRQAMALLGKGKEQIQITPSEFLALSEEILRDDKAVLSLERIAYDLSRWRERILDEYTLEGAPAP